MEIKLTKTQERKLRKTLLDDFKDNVVMYAIDKLKEDLQGGIGLRNDVESYLNRLEAWIIVEEVRRVE